MPSKVLIMFAGKSRWLGIFFLWAIGLQNVQAAPELSTSDSAPTAGYFQLTWSEKLPSGSILQQSTSPDFASVREWQVSDSESFSMSGLSNGEYFYRLQNAADQSWSNTVTVRAQHHSLAKAWLFFAVGALLFVYLVAYIFLHQRRKPAFPG